MRTVDLKNSPINLLIEGDGLHKEVNALPWKITVTDFHSDLLENAWEQMRIFREYQDGQGVSRLHSMWDICNDPGLSLPEEAEKIWKAVMSFRVEKKGEEREHERRVVQ